MFSKSINSKNLFSILFNASGSHKSKMAAHKQGELIYELVYNVAAKAILMSVEVEKFR